jgi:LysM repeat protein
MDKLNAGDKLIAGQSLTSPNGKYDLTMQSDGNLVLYDSGKPVWASETAGSGAERLEMQPDGNLVIYGKKDKPVWSSKTNGNNGASLALQDDRNLVIYPTAGPALWASASFDKAAPPVAPASMTKAKLPEGMVPGAGSSTKTAAASVKPAAASARPVAAATGGAATGGAATATKGASKTYTVERGDSLWAIAERFYGDGDKYTRIAKANNITNPDRINPGQKIIIPD